MSASESWVGKCFTAAVREVYIHPHVSNGVTYCSSCGVQNSALAKFCANCGNPFLPERATAETGQIAPRLESPVGQLTPTTYAPTFPATRYGGFWIRFLAFVVDWLVIAMVVFPISAIMSLMIVAAGHVVGMPRVGVSLVRIIVGLVFSACVNWIYEAAMESSSKQATLGKMALGLKVTDLEGRRISFARATGRHFAKILSGMILFIGFIMAGFTFHKQALHDLIASTLVVRAQ